MTVGLRRFLVPVLAVLAAGALGARAGEPGAATAAPVDGVGTATSSIAWVNGLAVRVGFVGPHEIGCAWRPGVRPDFLLWLRNRGDDELSFGPKNVSVRAEGAEPDVAERLPLRRRPDSDDPPPSDDPPDLGLTPVETRRTPAGGVRSPRRAVPSTHPLYEPDLPVDSASGPAEVDWSRWQNRLRRATVAPGERVEGMLSAKPSPFLARAYVVVVHLEGEDLELRFPTDLVPPSQR